MFLLKFCFISFLAFNHFSRVFAGYDVVGKNLTNFLKHRGKRGLIFNNGGAAKFVIGPIFPITLADPIVWRSLICSYNIHVGNYKIPSEPLYPWDKWETFYARSNQGSSYPQTDGSREFLYGVLENYMTASHGNGRDCLLRSICENAQIHHHMDLFGQVLDVILTPGKGDVAPIYNHAYEMGRRGVDCFQYYNKCPKGLCFIDQFLYES
ncbi:uncharacterized protein ACRADG_002639 [Cochliomyia hominivorax]